MGPGTEKNATVRHKTFTYHTGLRWVGERAGALESDDKPVLRVAPPPEFRGESGTWTPEDLFVGAIEACLMTTFLALAAKGDVQVRDYACEAEGVLEFVDSGYRFTRVTLRPRVEIEGKSDIEAARQVLQKAHHLCLISNSVTAEVIVEAEVVPSPPR